MGRRKRPPVVENALWLHRMGEPYDQIWRRLGFQQAESFDRAMRRAGWTGELYEIKCDREARQRWQARQAEERRAKARARRRRRRVAAVTAERFGVAS